ncbi:transglutaminase family protein [Pseudooceanicola sp. 216_PA32_1]|jgi:transglutaminase-like putative cysteine protease|uniref:Transglutaminase family protein n=1 Tax=Pseudooceanicola pacificus TaxID=2676438 RepID=A0A844W671_9RHOB|nr:transglutaminase family protein [Pseudooceanicola pacificus]MWB78565.1 transglutaminase family protein [Pseudooceanicola pacificus]
MRLKISHKTTYTYDKPVYYALQQIRLTPRTADGQKVLNWTSTFTGGERQVSFEDQFRNPVDLVLMAGTEKLEIVSEGEVEVEDRNGVVGMGKGLMPLWVFMPKTAATSPGPQLRKLVKPFEKQVAEDQLATMHRLSEAIGEAVEYTVGATTSATTAEEAVVAGKGVCQDHAHVMITAARLLGRPARYVSGYLLMEGVTEQDATHAWCEIFIERLGWVGFDVSNAVCPDDRYVRVAVGRDYADAAPVHGLRQGDAQEELCVSLQVQQ